jgi:hypothetical protein
MWWYELFLNHHILELLPVALEIKQVVWLYELQMTFILLLKMNMKINFIRERLKNTHLGSVQTNPDLENECGCASCLFAKGIPEYSPGSEPTVNNPDAARNTHYCKGKTLGQE